MVTASLGCSDWILRQLSGKLDSFLDMGLLVMGSVPDLVCRSDCQVWSLLSLGSPGWILRKLSGRLDSFLDMELLVLGSVPDLA